jgi:hypothetical protein
MAKRFMSLIVLGAGLLGCRGVTEPSGQWVLESYSADRGYVFRKDGVEYLARCAQFDSAELIQKQPEIISDSSVAPALPPGWTPIPKPGLDWRPILSPTHNEWICSPILPYLHKSVSLRQRARDKDILVFIIAEDGSLKDGALEFIITEAK